MYFPPRAMKMIRQAGALATALALQAGTAWTEEGCADITGIDACVVGIWQMESGGPAEWMRKYMPAGVKMPGMDGPAGGRIHYRADGTFTGALATGTDGEAVGEQESTSSGRWAVKDGKLYQCTESTSFSPAMQINGRNVALSVPSGGGAQSFDYSCDGDRLETSLTIPGMPEPMVTRFVRAGE